MIKKIYCGIGLSILLTNISMAMVIDAPHDEAVSGIRCVSCHNYSLWWRYSPAGADGSPPRGEITSTVCLQCHNNPDGPTPYKKPHSSVSFGTTAQHADWSTNCTDCHSPHFQAQLDWLGSNSDDLYLVTGMIGAAGSFVLHGNGTTTFTYTTTAADPLWADPYTWTNKSGAGRSLIFVDDIENATNTHTIVAADANTLTVTGGLGSGAAGHTFGLIYGQLIKSSIATPHGGQRSVKFFDPNKTFAVGGFTEPSVPEPQGICQVCHTETKYWRHDGQNADPLTGKLHNPAIVCTACHTAVSGFKPSGGPHPFLGETPFCMTCHASGDILAVHNNDCQNCHTIPPALADPASKPLVITIARGACQDCHGAQAHDSETAHDHRQTVASCAACHAVATAVAIDTLHQQDCGTCHGYSGSKLNPTVVANAIAAGKGVSGQEVNCQTCHLPGAGLHPTDIAGIAPWHEHLLADGACACCHESDTAEKRLALHPDCFTCHASAKVTVRAAISAGRAGAEVRCGSCHSGDSGSAMVHGTTPATVAPLHDSFAADEFCGGCHDIDTAEERIIIHPDCFTCHSSSKAVVQDSIRLGRSGTTVNCSVCHTGGDGAISHGATPATVAAVHDLFGATVQCAGCHAIDSAEQRIALHPSCTTCHTSTTGAVVEAIRAGRNGTAVHCGTCHNGALDGAMSHPMDVAGIAPWHEQFKPEPACASCHDIGSAEQRIALHPSCMTCHHSTKEAVVETIAAGRAGTPVTCANCHGAEVRDLHHASANAARGNCTWCHADPRPNWSAQAPGDNGGSSPVPTQLACAACHVRISGDTVYVDKLSYANDGSPVARTVQHTINGVTAGYIYNYGMCFSCHDGVKAPQVTVFHAKPQAADGPRFDRMAGAPGKGTFNLFWGEFHLEQEMRGSDYLRNLRQGYFFAKRDELYRVRDFYKSHPAKEYLQERQLLWQQRAVLFQRRDQFKQHRITYIRQHQRDNQYPAAGYGYRLPIPCGAWNGCAGSAAVPVLAAQPVPH